MEIAYYKGGGDGETAAAYCVQTYYFCKSYLHICIQSHLKREDFDFLITYTANIKRHPKGTEKAKTLYFFIQAKNASINKGFLPPEGNFL